MFPEPEMDPVIQIANVVSVQGENGPIVKNVFTVKKCSPIAGAEVRCYKTEVRFARACACVRVSDGWWCLRV